MHLDIDAGLFLSVLLWLGSWASKNSTASFLSLESIRFWIPNPIQVVHWVPPLILLIVPFFTIFLIYVGGITNKLILSIILKYPIVLRHVAPGIFATLMIFYFNGRLTPEREKLKVPDSLENTVYYEGVKVKLEKVFDRYRRTESGSAGTILSDIFIPLSTDTFKLNTNIEFKHSPREDSRIFASKVNKDKIKKYNVITIIVESLRADELEVFGGLPDYMPEINNMAKEASSFTRCYTQASHSNYANLGPLRGQYPLRSEGTHVYPLNPQYPRTPIYDILKPLGWQTGIISSSNDHWGKVINYLDTGSLDIYLNPENMGASSSVAETDLGFAKWVANTKHAGSVDDKFTVGKAIEWIDATKEPFYLYLNMQTTHFPYRLPKDAKAIFAPEEIDFRMEFNFYPKDKIPFVKAKYHDASHYVDEQLGALFSYLKRANKWDSTIIVFTGDHGQAFYEHGFASHANSLYNEVMRVPLVIKIPGKVPAKIDTLVEHVDVPPTIFSILGLPNFDGFQGNDIFTKNKQSSAIAFMVSQTPLAHQYGSASENYKIIYDMNKDSFYGFDLKSDPGESRVIDTESNEEILREKNILKAWVAEQLDYYSNPKRMAAEFAPQLTSTN